jgi:hypothetical protein
MQEHFFTNYMDVMNVKNSGAFFLPTDINLRPES